jgi:uncharacterized protein (TIGR02266 family)
MTELPTLEIRFSSLEEFEKEYRENLSKGGIFIATEEPPPLRARVEFNLYPPDQETPILLAGEVVHIISPDQSGPGMNPGVALQILNYDENLDQELKNFLAEQESPKGLEDLPDEEDRKEEPAAEESEESEEKEDAEVERTVKNFEGLNPENLFISLRGLPRNEKIKLAKRGPKKILNLLIQEGDKQIMRFVIQNPRLGIPEVLSILKSPHTSMELIQTIGKNSGWMQSDEVRYHLVINPKTPLPLALNQLKGLNIKDLAKLAKSSHVKAQIKSSALKLLMLRRSGAG